MSDVMNNPPASLRKQGITHAVDNIGPDQELVIPGASFNVFFGDAIQAFIKKKRRETAEPGTE